jgi:hypothetical protein
VPSIIYIEKKVLIKKREKPVPAFPQLESFAPCFRDSPPGAVCVETLREVRLAASRGNRVQTNEQARISEPFAVALCLSGGARASWPRGVHFTLGSAGPWGTTHRFRLDPADPPGPD